MLCGVRPVIAAACVAALLVAGTAAQTGAGQPVSPPPPGAEAGVDPGAAYTHFRVGNRNVKSIYTDGTVIWIGTTGGLVRYETETNRFRLFDTKSGLLSRGIFFVGRIRGRLTVGTYGGGMSVLDETTWQWRNYNVPQGLGDAFVYDVLEAGNGDIWIATWSGANRIEGGRLDAPSAWQTYTVANTGGGLINDWVYGLEEGAEGTIWLATEGGMVRFKDGNWQNWDHAHGLGAPYEEVKEQIGFREDPADASSHHIRQKQEAGLQDVSVAYNPNYVVSLAIDKHGTVWAGTWGGGLSRFDGERWHNYTTADGLAANHVFMLFADSSGSLWIGTSAGLQSWDNGRFGPLLTVRDGLFAETVFSLAIDQDDSLWVGSYGGVTRLRRRQGVAITDGASDDHQR
jgi:ligand-binding sensor domain-containing protein